jgi:hypothetical protein
MRALDRFGVKAGTLEFQYGHDFRILLQFYRARRLGACVPHPPAPKDSLPT